MVMRIVIAIALGAALAVTGAYVLAGRAEGPRIEVLQPGRLVGTASPLDVVIETPGGVLRTVEVVLEQDGQQLALFSLEAPQDAEIRQETPDRMRLRRTIGRRSNPGLQPGAARLLVTATRPVLLGWRTAETTLARDLELRFDPPRLSVVSTHHFINHGGAEMVVYRVDPPDVVSGVQVGDVSYPGYPAAGAGVEGADPALKVAMFAVLYDQDLRTPLELFAEDEAANRGRAAIDHRVFPRDFRRSRIEVTDGFIDRVVPPILDRSPELDAVWGMEEEARLAAFQQVNGDLREMNAATIQRLADETASEALWRGAFRQLGNSQVESGFADHRTYYYEGREIDQQVHLGFDLAVTAAVPIGAANRGRVLHADYLGIYGNCVILDHGMGLQSLYAHLSSIDVTPGDLVEQGDVIGRSGMTGLAGGDHLHFTMLLQGRPISPIEWWDPHWIQDRVQRKFDEVARSNARQYGQAPSHLESGVRRPQNLSRRPLVYRDTSVSYDPRGVLSRQFGPFSTSFTHTARQENRAWI